MRSLWNVISLLKESLQMVGAFLPGKTDILDELRCGRPVEVTDDYHVEKNKVTFG